MLDIFREEIYGKAEWECGRAKPWIVTTCVMYALMAAAIIVSVLNGTPLFALPGAAMVCFIIGRIYRLHCSVALVCRENLLILAAGKFSRGRGLRSWLLDPVYFVAEYREITGFSERWNEMYIGAERPGGLMSVPVPLAFVSRRDKDRLCRLIEEKQRGVWEN